MTSAGASAAGDVFSPMVELSFSWRQCTPGGVAAF